MRTVHYPGLRKGLSYNTGGGIFLRPPGLLKPTPTRHHKF
nr:MAG TPA: hypothetical protein [Caudoviricetes sp.]